MRWKIFQLWINIACLFAKIFPKICTIWQSIYKLLRRSLHTSQTLAKTFCGVGNLNFLYFTFLLTFYKHQNALNRPTTENWQNTEIVFKRKSWNTHKFSSVNILRHFRVTEHAVCIFRRVGFSQANLVKEVRRGELNRGKNKTKVFTVKTDEWFLCFLPEIESKREMK